MCKGVRKTIKLELGYKALKLVESHERWKGGEKKKTFIFVVYSIINNNIMIFILLSLDKKKFISIFLFLILLFLVL